jgi:hypothetical protein
MAKAEFNKKKSFYQQLAKEHEGMLLQSWQCYFIFIFYFYFFLFSFYFRKWAWSIGTNEHHCQRVAKIIVSFLQDSLLNPEFQIKRFQWIIL